MATQRKWALITGVSEGGLGEALARELLANNINVIITGLKLEHLDYFSNGATSRVEKLELDVTSASSISAAVVMVRDIAGGRLDILINNAGYGYMMPLIDADIERVKKNFDVNVFGVLSVTQAFFPLLRPAKGMVVNQASIAGLANISQPFIGSYSASKTAVLDMSNTLRVELAPFDIKVCSSFGLLPRAVILTDLLGHRTYHWRRKDSFLD
jgi:NAD(P)-dependent dehydrogenase (short-subunit alcohol dehydrogenase family)